MRTIIVKTPRTVPKGINTHMIAAVTKQNRYFFVFARHLPAYRVHIARIQPAIINTRAKTIKNHPIKAGGPLPRLSFIVSGAKTKIIPRKRCIKGTQEKSPIIPPRI